MQERERSGLPPHIYPPEEWRLVEKAFAPQYLAQMETIFATSNARGVAPGGRCPLPETRPAGARSKSVEIPWSPGTADRHRRCID